MKKRYWYVFFSATALLLQLQCFLVARGGRNLDFFIFLAGIVLMIIGLKLFADLDKRTRDAAWKRFMYGLITALAALIG